ncbi:LEA type 2 family protein [Zooshikella marina]|uniref:LEA type 2 family protein n=1 Tax=Zooshikella ganghwensis TaxID=202772 RepID=UPI001BB097EB|nr:LEA type 2 family protein [Zooshikella ganghwensis]MBU2704816.1 LEA type 2 family protein [Zooshikella ganghwensis]
MHWPFLPKAARLYITLLANLLLLAGCATLSGTYEKPQLSLNSLHILEPDGLTQRFALGLQIMNPNDQPLNIKGLYYTIELEGYELISGVSNQIPEVPAFGTANFTVHANTNLINSIRFINAIIKQPKDTFSYSLSGKLSLDNFYPRQVNIEQEGNISLKH